MGGRHRLSFQSGECRKVKVFHLLYRRRNGWLHSSSRRCQSTSRPRSYLRQQASPRLRLLQRMSAKTISCVAMWLSFLPQNTGIDKRSELSFYYGWSRFAQCGPHALRPKGISLMGTLMDTLWERAEGPSAGLLNLLREMARPERFELPTPRFVVWGASRNPRRSRPTTHRCCGREIVDLCDGLGGEENMAVKSDTNFGQAVSIFLSLVQCVIPSNIHQSDGQVPVRPVR